MKKGGKKSSWYEVDVKETYERFGFVLCLKRQKGIQDEKIYEKKSTVWS